MSSASTASKFRRRPVYTPHHTTPHHGDTTPQHTTPGVQRYNGTQTEWNNGQEGPSFSTRSAHNDQGKGEDVDVHVHVHVDESDGLLTIYSFISLTRASYRAANVDIEMAHF